MVISHFSLYCEDGYKWENLLFYILLFGWPAYHNYDLHEEGIYTSNFTLIKRSVLEILSYLFYVYVSGVGGGGGF